MGRVFRNFFCIALTVGAFCADASFCASVTSVTLHAAGSHQAEIPDANILAPLDETGEIAILPLKESHCDTEIVLSQNSFLPQESMHECIWFEVSRPLGTERHDNTFNINTDGPVVTASAEDSFDIMNPDSPISILMILISVLAMIGYILERIIAGRQRSRYGGY